MAHFCTKCDFETRHYAKLITHYRFVHSQENGFFLTCPADCCQKQYSNVDSFLKHLKRKHRDFYALNISGWGELNRQPSVFDDILEVQEDLHTQADVETDEDAHVDFKTNTALFLLNIREKYKLPCVVIPQFVAEFLTQVGLHQAEVSQSILNYCEQNGVSEHHLESLKNLLQTPSEVEAAFSSLNSELRLNKFAKEKLCFVAPVEYKPEIDSSDTYQYIPILETLKSLLQFDDVFSHVLHPHFSSDGNLRDFCDGNLFKTSTMFQSDPSNLQIMLYYDEFTAVNPLGHQVKSYKIGAFYMLLGNLPPKFRSQLHIIQLVMLCHSNSVKRYGFKAIMQPLMHDLSVLETTGITVSKSDRDYTFKGTISVVIADNLGAHGIGGFMESFNTMRSCRFCFATKQDLKSTFDSSKLNMRSVEMYKEQVKLVETTAHLANVYGIKRNSPLNDLEFYHVINGLPADIAHDLFEGVVCDVMTHVVRHCVQQEFFSLEYLNDSLASFEYSKVDIANKPCKVQQVLRKLSIRQSASQMNCFVRLLPLIVGALVPKEDPKWEVLLMLRDVLVYVCSPVLHEGHTVVLSEIVEDFLESFLATFPEESLKPKFHYLLHYPMLMRQFGPLIHQQTLRFEGKHNYFKELVFRTKNRKNVCKTLAQRHQYYQCTFNASKNLLTNEKIPTAHAVALPSALLNDQLQTLLMPLLGEQIDVYVSKSMTVYGIEYSIGACIVVGLEGDLYCFSKIVHCSIINAKPYLICSKLRTITFDRHMYAYMVEETHEYNVISVAELSDPKPLGMYTCPAHPQKKLIVIAYKVLFE